MEIKQSTCNYCSIACNMDFHVEDNHIERVTPTKDYPVNHGFCCVKGLNLDKQNTLFKNPKTPLMKDEQGKWQSISWDEAFKALQHVLKGFKRSMERKVSLFLVQDNCLLRKWHFLDI